MYQTDSRLGQQLRDTGKTLVETTDSNSLVLVHSIPGGVAGVARYMQLHSSTDAGVGYAAWVGQLNQRRLPEDMELLAAAPEKIVFVEVHSVWEPAPEKQWLEQNATLIDTKRLGAVRLYYYKI